MKKKREKTTYKHGFFVLPFVAVICFVLGSVAVLKIPQLQDFFNKKEVEENKITQIGFKDIGELATQDMIGTVVRNEESSLHFMIDIPLTDTHYIYSYDFEIKAGFDFEDIKCTINADTKEIEVNLPEAKILSNEVKVDSFQVYLENESVFNKKTLTDNNNALIEMEKEAEDKAKENGILEKATGNAKTLIKSFLSNMYDLNEYQLVFK